MERKRKDLKAELLDPTVQELLFNCVKEFDGGECSTEQYNNACDSVGAFIHMLGKNPAEANALGMDFLPLVTNWMFSESSLKMGIDSLSVFIFTNVMLVKFSKFKIYAEQLSAALEATQHIFTYWAINTWSLEKIKEELVLIVGDTFPTPQQAPVVEHVGEVTKPGLDNVILFSAAEQTIVYPGLEGDMLNDLAVDCTRNPSLDRPDAPNVVVTKIDNKSTSGTSSGTPSWLIEILMSGETNMLKAPIDQLDISTQQLIVDEFFNHQDRVTLDDLMPFVPGITILQYPTCLPITHFIVTECPRPCGHFGIFTEDDYRVYGIDPPVRG